MWAFVGSKKNQQWVWLAWSFQTGQVLAFAVGPRDLKTAKKLRVGIPTSYSRKSIYTDGLGIYESLISFHRHWVAEKGSGGTNIAEGGNTYLRHRVSYLVRKSSSFARNVDWLIRRLYFVLFTRNERIKNLFQKQEK